MTSDSAREALITDFLSQTDWGDATFSWLGQDASTRRYGRLVRGDMTALLMDAPLVESGPCRPEMSEAERHAAGWNALSRLAASRVDAFTLISGHLRSLGLRAPEVYAHDTHAGLALVEDFGHSREFARLIERGEAQESDLYRTAAERLAKLHLAPMPDMLAANGEHWPILSFDRLALKANSDLYANWLHLYDDRARMTDTDRSHWEDALAGLIEQAEGFPRAFTLRDYHAENLIWLPEGDVGLLDFQDAVQGWDAWDMAMLTQDARRDVSPEATNLAIRTYLDATGKEDASFQERLSVIGTLNALRIVGVFARLVTRDKREKYKAFMPRQQLMLARNLNHPAAADMAGFIRDTAPFILEAGR